MYLYYIMSYSNGLLPSTSTSTNEPQRGLPGIGFKLTADGNFDLDNKQMKNLSGGTDKSDAVNYGQLLEHTENHQNNYHLQPSFKFYRNFGNEAIVPQSNTIKIDSNHNHHGLNWIVKEGSDSGFGGQAWVSLKMTNNLPVGIYTVVFELFSGISGISGSVTQLNNETLLQQVHGDANYTIITFSHDYQTTHSKAFIQFNSNGQAGEITFQIRYYGSSYNNTSLNFLFYSRVVAGRQGTAFNHALFDVDDVQLKNQILYFEDVNLNDNKLKNIAPAEDYSDAVNLRQIIDINQPYFYELNNFQFYKITRIHPINVTIPPDLPSYNIIRKHNHHVVYITNFFSGKWEGSNYISMEHSFRNLNLDAGNYTFILELIKDVYRKPNNYSKNNVFLVDITTNNGINLTKYAHQYVDNEYNKVVLQFTSNGTNNGRINFKFQKNNRKYDNILVFIKLVFGTIEVDFDHNILNDDGRSTVFLTNVDMNNKKIDNLADPTEDSDATNKKYVDDEIAKLPHSDTGTLKLDGSRAMIGTLNLGGQRVVNIKGFVEDDSSQSASDAQKYDVVNWGKIHEIRGDLKREINAVEYEALNRINPNPMEDDIDMGNNFITNIKEPGPSNSQYVATVNFVNKTVSDNNTTISTLIDSKINERDHLNIKAAKQENVFSFVMIDDLFKEDDSDITKVGKVNKDFYDIHKETYQFNISYDGNIGHYSTRTGIDLKAIDLGEYTLVFEMYFDGSKIDKNEVIVNAVSTPLNISRNRTNKFADHSRTVINFHKYGNIGIINLDIDITEK